MGTDIHLGVEAKVPGEGRKYRWEPLDLLPTGDEIGRAYSALYREGATQAEKEAAEHVINSDPAARSYNTFALLAGVRNGVGFAGHRRGEPVVPVAEGRGIPEDTSFPDDLDCGWLGGEHSHTWLTYTEAVTAPWARVVKTFGLVAFVEWVRWKRSSASSPQTWCLRGPRLNVREEEAKKLWSRIRRAIGGVPPNVETRFPARWVDPRRPDDEVVWVGDVHVAAEWEWKPLANAPFRMWLLSAPLQQAAVKYGGDNIRICMSFDS